MYDFIAIGDTATDVFIKLEDDSRAAIEGAPDTADYRLCLPFGEKIPYTEATTVQGVGNAANAAVSASLLGLRSALVAHVGGDRAGQETIDSLKAHNVDTTFVVPEAGKHTNYSYILWYKQERTILRKHEDFSYSLPNIDTPAWVYFSAVGAGAEKYYEDFAQFIENKPSIKFAFQPGGNEITLGTKLLRFYKRADIFFCNVEESEKILGKPAGTDIKDLLLGIHLLGPQAVVITDGPKGAYGADKTGIYFAPPFNPEEEAFERTGAGDAFASATTSALALGKTLPEALAWGAVNGMSVCRYVGAQKGLLTQAQIEAELSKKPDYQVSKTA